MVGRWGYFSVLMETLMIMGWFLMWSMVEREMIYCDVG